MQKKSGWSPGTGKLASRAFWLLEVVLETNRAEVRRGVRKANAVVSFILKVGFVLCFGSCLSYSFGDDKALCSARGEN